MTDPRLSRRGFLAAAGTLPLFAPTLLRAETPDAQVEASEPVRRNISSFQAMNWQDHFESLGTGAIVADTVSRALHYWSGDGQTYKLYPTSVPRTEDLTKRGYTKVVRKKVGPSWTPTPSMHERFPDLPRVMGPGPDNPLGSHALYLSWPAYLIHGTHDTRKIGRRSSDGCIGLYNEKIAELFALVPVGTQVRLL